MPNAYFALFFVPGFIGLWMAVLVILSHIGGWASLADQYRCTEPFEGSRWNFERGQFRWIAGYNNCLTMGADPRGLFLGIFPLFRVAHPPLFIPWREISVSRKKIFRVKYVRLLLGNELKIPLTISEPLAQKLQAAAGSSWPVESTTSPE
jgi:hypothetical protein